MRGGENCEPRLKHCFTLILYYVANGRQVVNVMHMTEAQFLSWNEPMEQRRCCCLLLLFCSLKITHLLNFLANSYIYFNGQRSNLGCIWVQGLGNANLFLFFNCWAIRLSWGSPLILLHCFETFLLLHIHTLLCIPWVILQNTEPLSQGPVWLTCLWLDF